MSHQGLEQEISAMLLRYVDRFCSLEHYVKEIKERFSRWFNKKHSRRGTLWMDRYKSVLVEAGKDIRTIAAYIDLNPVKAEICKSAAEYQWCGFNEAKNGSKRARTGICRAMEIPVNQWAKCSTQYRKLLSELQETP